MEKPTCKGSHSVPLLQQPWEQNMLPCHVQPEFASPLQNEEKKMTLSEDLNSDTRVKKDVQDKGERGEKQGSKDTGKKATQNNHW